MKKVLFLLFHLMFLGTLIISCRNTPTPARTSTFPAPAVLPSAIATFSSPPVQSPTFSPTSFIREMRPDWRVAYYDPLTSQLCVIYGDGSDKVCLEGSMPYDSYRGPSWSPDGNRLAFNKNTFGIYLWEPGGNIITFRDSTAGETFHDMDWSPDGNFIAYSSTELFRYCATCQAYYRDIFIDSLDGTVHRHVTAKLISADSPDWAPDGQSIVFAADGEIFLFSLHADKAFNLTQHAANEMNPKWSPDGRLIAFLSDRAGLANLYVMNSDGLEVREVANLDINLYGQGPEATRAYTYTWLPDGKRILYSSTTFTETSGSREYTYHNKLIDLETGSIADVQLPFEGSRAVWYMPSNLEIVPSYQTALPFEPISEMPPDEFLFVFLYDDDYSTCLDGLCACPVSEFPADSFMFVDDKLLLIKQDFEPMPEDWITFRKNSGASILYNFYSSQLAEFRLFSSFPVETPIGNFVITGINARGEIQVQTKEGNMVVGVGRKAFSEEPEQKDEGCRILHKYSLTNYGFIKDEQVQLVTGW